MDNHIESINDETLALVFPYDAEMVTAIKALQNRRWNAGKRRWEVHLSHLADAMRILGLSPRDVDEAILDRYRSGGWARCRLKVELGPLIGRLAGSGAPLAEVDAVTSFFVPGYKFSPKFIAKKWDGRKHLFNRRNQTFPAGLWPRVHDVLDAHGAVYELDDTTVPPGVGEQGDLLGSSPERVPLRDYQARIVEDALARGRGIIQLATGGGKTLLAAHLIRRIGRPTFFFVHTLDLLYQSAGVLTRELGIEVGLLGDGQANLRPVTVATIQTAARAFEEAGSRSASVRKAKTETDGDEPVPQERELNLDEATREQIRHAIEAAEVTIFDECHHIPADTFYKVAMHAHEARWRFGLSATPWRDDQCDLLLEAALGGKIAEINCSVLIRQGYLVAPVIRMEAAPPLKMKVRGVRYPDCYQLAIVENQERNRVIAARARAWVGENRSVLILVSQVAHGRILQELLPEASFVFGALESEVRRECLRKLEQKLQPIMIATTLADEGLDIPSLGAVILAGGGKSQTKAYQRIGRALRPAPGKAEAFILDFFDDVPYLREHSQARLRLYQEEPLFKIETA